MAHGETQKPTLTEHTKTADLSSLPIDSSDDFDFPTLNTDGSVPDLIETRPPPGQRTPPAALSSLGIKMAADSKTDAVTELNDGQYDMVDDASEISNDSNETVSIASDNLNSDEDVLLTPDDEDEAENLDPDQEIFTSNHSSPAGPSAGPLHHQLLMLEKQHKQKLRQAREEKLALQKEYESEKEKTLDSFLSEDLETPRQSTINAFIPPSSKNASGDRDGNVKASSASFANQSDLLSAQARPARSSTEVIGDFVMHAIHAVKQSPGSKLLLLLMTMVLISFMVDLSANIPTAPFRLDTRREALSGSLVKLTNSTNATKSFNIEHLLPAPTTLSSTDIFGRPEVGTSEVHFQGVPPNYIIVSLPNEAGRVPRVISTTVQKGDRPIAFNQTKLIDGVYAITLDSQDAHGIVTVEMPCKKPNMTVQLFYNFGRRYLQLPTFEKTRTDLSNTVTKDVAIARARTRSFYAKIGAGFVTTHNVSTQVAQQVAQQVSHEAQVIASTAASVAEKWYSACDATASSVRKDIMAIQERLERAETEIDEYVADVAGRVKRSVMEPFAVAQERAGRIRAKYFGSNAAREKVCKRGAKDNTASLFTAAAPRCGGFKTAKNGQLVEKKSCGACSNLKQHLKGRQSSFSSTNGAMTGSSKSAARKPKDEQ